ncbi:MAG: hypothetical protein JXR03_16830 [Cyclobacteriaceae bacterium]
MEKISENRKFENQLFDDPFEARLNVGNKVKFVNCTFSENVLIDMSSSSQVSFTKCSFSNNLTLKGNSSDLKLLSIQNCNFGGSLDFDGYKGDALLEGQFKIIKLNGGEAKLSFISRKEVLSEVGEIEIGNGIYTLDLGTNNEFKDISTSSRLHKGSASVSINGNPSKVGNLTLTECAKVEVKFDKTRLETLELMNNAQSHIAINKKSSIETISISGESNCLNSFRIVDSIVRDLSIKEGIYQSIYLKDCTNGTFNLISEPFTSESSLDITNSSFHIMSVDSSINGNRFKVIKSKVSQEFSLLNTFLNNTYFSDFDLKNARLKFYHSHLAEIRYSNIQWPDYDQYFIPEDTDFSQLREMFRQLKSLSVRNHNFLDAERFHALELDATLKCIDSGRWYNENWFLLFTNKLFTNFNRSWILPIGFGLLFHLILVALIIPFSLTWKYFLFVNNLGFTDFDILEFLQFYTYTLYPFHRFEYNSVALPPALDVLTRIVSSYFAYYSLKAARRFGRI